MSQVTKQQIKALGWREPPRAASNSGQHEQLSRLRSAAVRAEEAITTTRLIANIRRPPHTGNSNAAFVTNPIFTTMADEEPDEEAVLPPLPEVQVTSPPRATS